VERRLIDPLDREQRLFRRNAVAGEGAGSELPREHAQVLHAAFGKAAANAEFCRLTVPEVAPALTWALENDWTLAAELSMRAAAYCKSQGRLAEGAELLADLYDEAQTPRRQRRNGQLRVGTVVAPWRHSRAEASVGGSGAVAPEV
jgi:hypothetical protein